MTSLLEEVLKPLRMRIKADVLVDSLKGDLEIVTSTFSKEI